MKKKLLPLFLLPLFFFTGCGGGRNISDSIIIKAVCVDYQDGQFHVALSSFGETSGEERPPDVFFSGTGPTVASAVQKAVEGQEDSPYMGHNEVLVLSKEAARAHLEEVTTFFLADSTARPNMNLFISEENAFELVQKAGESSPEALENFVRRNKEKFRRLFELYHVSDSEKAYCLPVIGLQEGEESLVLKEYMVFNADGYVFSYNDHLDLVTVMLKGANNFSFSERLDDYGLVNGKVEQVKFSYQPDLNKQAGHLAITLTGTLEKLSFQEKSFGIEEDKTLIENVEQSLCGEMQKIADRAYKEHAVDLFQYNWYIENCKGAPLSPKSSPPNYEFRMKLTIL